MYDLVIFGGWIADGSGGALFRGDVGIAGDQIKTIGVVSPNNGRLHIDATNRIVFPGFVDAHAHIEGVLTEDSVNLALLRQGVTTVIAGQDGISYVPASRDTVSGLQQYFGAVNGFCPPELRSGGTVGDFLSYCDGRASINTAALVPLGTVRGEVLGFERRSPTDEEVAVQQRAVEGAMSDGAVGVSTGLNYSPGCFADSAELRKVVRPAAEAGRVFVSHIRHYEALAWAGMHEFLDVVEQAGMPGHVSHFHGPANMLAGLVYDARNSGVDVTYDTYPYLSGSSILSMYALPAELSSLEPVVLRSRLGERSTRDRLSQEWFPAIQDRVGRTRISFVSDPELEWAEGLVLADAASRADRSISDFVCQLVVSGECGSGCVVGHGPLHSDSDMRMLLKNDAHMAGSDGIWMGSHPHPRGWGAFARLLSRHTRELGDWNWPMAAIHMSSHAARRFSLDRRGLVRAGFYADLAVVDPRSVADSATIESPRSPAVGISDVVVNGAVVLRDGDLTGVRAGRGLRASS